MNETVRFIIILAIIGLIGYMLMYDKSEKPLEKFDNTSNTSNIGFIAAGAVNTNHTWFPDVSIPRNTLIADGSQQEQFLDDFTQVLPTDLDSNSRRFVPNNQVGMTPGQTRVIDFADGNRDQSSVAVDKALSDSNNLIENGIKQNTDNFVPFDETNNMLAPFKGSQNQATVADQNTKPEEVFNLDYYLPKDEKTDWWDNVPDPVSTSNRHLINTNRPIGVDTIGSSNKNASYDVRGEPPNPRFYVGPWGNSSISPSLGFRPLC